MKIENLEDTLLDEAEGGASAHQDDSTMDSVKFLNYFSCVSWALWLCLHSDFVLLQTFQGAAKTPVSLLQELYVKRGINPKYDLIQIEGAIHEPTFKYRVSVGDIVGM